MGTCRVVALCRSSRACAVHVRHHGVYDQKRRHRLIAELAGRRLPPRDRKPSSSSVAHQHADYTSSSAIECRFCWRRRGLSPVCFERRVHPSALAGHMSPAKACRLFIAAMSSLSRPDERLPHRRHGCGHALRDLRAALRARRRRERRAGFQARRPPQRSLLCFAQFCGSMRRAQAISTKRDTVRPNRDGSPAVAGA